MKIEREFLLNLIRASVVGTISFSIPDTVNWPLLIEEAARQNVSVIASDGLQILYDKGMYSELGDKDVRRMKARWFAKTMKYEQRYTNQVFAAKKMGEWFAAAGIQTVILKGFSVSECYPVPAHRYSADLDCFLIKDGNHIDAYELGNRIIEKKGLSVDRSYYKNSTFDISGLHVENHKFCTPFRGNKTLRQLELVLQGMILDGPLVPIGGTRLLTPPALATALFLIEHSYSHFLHEGLNLRHFLDWFLFRQKHISDVDWDDFERYLDLFGFRRFYYAFSHVGEYVAGIYDYSRLTDSERRMMCSVWDGLDLHENIRGFTGKARLLGNTYRAAWKYRDYSSISMLKALWIQIKGFLFMRNPKL